METEGPPNKEMQQTKSAFTSIAAAFAADLQCSAATTTWLEDRDAWPYE